jgi:hypothetical protein
MGLLENAQMKTIPAAAQYPPESNRVNKNIKLLMKKIGGGTSAKIPHGSSRLTSIFGTPSLDLLPESFAASENSSAASVPRPSRR